MQETEVRAAVSEITVEVIAQKLSDLNVEISRTLSGLGEKMNGEVGLLRSLREAVALESKDLQRLHGIDITATSIDLLLADYQEKKASLEADLLNARKEWTIEAEEKKQEEAEYAETLKKNRAREIEDYEYKKNLERKKLQDRFEEECRLKEKQNRETQENLEKSWNEKETALKGREEELAALKEEVDQFQQRLATECTKAAKEATKEAEAKYNQEIERLKRDLLVEKQIGELKLKQLQESLASQQAQMGSLQAQLDEAKRQVQDIAVKAIEGASGAKALSQINQIAMEQAKNRIPN
jgi:chromosome segregation ATPase